MKRALLCLVAVFAVVSFATIASAKKVTSQRLNYESAPAPDAYLPPDLDARYGSLMRSAAAADTFILHDEDFDTPGGQPDTGGYVSVDVTEQIKTFWHVGLGTGELDGGTFGGLLPITGNASMWCGEPASSTIPFCGYASLPGYGNGWDQILYTPTPVGGDSIVFSYNVQWDSEPGYDGTVVEYSFDGGAWAPFAIIDTLSARAGLYDGLGALSETVHSQSPGASNFQVRFRFQSDTAWSDEDGLWPTDGAILVDDLSLTAYNGGLLAGTDTEDFESWAEGETSHVGSIWTGTGAPNFGDFADLYNGLLVLQEDPCFLNTSFFWGFFDDPSITPYDCHVPDPELGQGAMRYGDVDLGIYMSNEVWSPVFDNTGSGVEYRLLASSYRDLPLDNLQFYVFHIRSWNAGCPGGWRDFNLVYFGDNRDWLTQVWSIGSITDGGAEQLQVAVGALDACSFWCGTPVGTGACHSHAPLLDNVQLQRIANFGPQYTVRHLELFQDNFALDGTLTGTSRADAAQDILPTTNPSILPGDSVAITISPLAEIGAGMGPNAYIYVSVWPQGSKTGASLGSSDGRPDKAVRYPYGGSVVIGGVTWEKFQMDTSFTNAGAPGEDRFCIDLNDALFTPGDTICYFIGADADNTPNNGTESYYHRLLNGQGLDNTTDDINEAAASPCEFTILPAGGYNNGGDILYVDDSDDRGGPAQLYYDTAFEQLGIDQLVDRFDVLGPSSNVGNGLAARVYDNVVQIVEVYQKILWNTTNLSAGLVGDGVGAEKTNSWSLLEQFVSTSPNDPGLYLSGDNIAEEWSGMTGSGAVNMRSSWMPFELLDGDHINHGEAVSPTLTATGTSFIHAGVPDELVAYGGCALINDFDVMNPLASDITTAQIEFPYPISGDGAVISAQDTNLVNARYTIVVSGFSYTYIRDTGALPPGQQAIARVEHLKDILEKMGNVIGTVTGIDDENPDIAQATSLHANYPNPFNPTTTIEYTLRERAHVSLKIYNAAGQLVKTLVDEVQSPGEVSSVRWDGRNNAGQTVSSGVYFYRMVTKNFVQTRKMVLLK